MSATTWTTCVRITRRDGVVIGLTELDRDIAFDGVTYRSAAGYTPTSLARDDGMAAGHADIEGLLAVAGVTHDDIRAGAYDGAAVDVLLLDWHAGTLVRHLASGHWGECTLHRGRYVAEFRGIAHRLHATVGRVYTPACDAELGDARCQAVVDGMEVTGAVTAQPSAIQVMDYARTEPDGRWRGGVLTFTSGANAGRSHEVRASTADGVLTLLTPLARPLAEGDGYVLRPGCDKRFETCRDVYANGVNFRGFPHVPGTLAVMRYGKGGA